MARSIKKRVTASAKQVIKKKSEEATATIRSIIHRSKSLIIPEPVAFNRKYTSQSGELPSLLKIATLAINSRDQVRLSEPRKKYGGYGLYHFDTQSLSAIRAQIIAGIKRAGSKGVQFFCVSELAFPTHCKTGNNDVKEQDFIDQLLKLSKKYKMYIICGTYHCPHSFYNISLIFYPEDELAGYGNPLKHAKKFSAALVDEEVKTPDSRNMRYYSTKFGVVAVLICLDSFDPTIVFGLNEFARSSGPDRKELDIVFIPSLSNHEKSVYAAKDLSYLLGCTCVLANDLSCCVNDDRCVFIGGNRQEGVRDKKITGLTVYQIKKSVIANQRTQIEKDRAKIYKKLFGDGTLLHNPL